MNVAVKADDLLGLAKSRAPADRERLLLAVVDLCEAGDPQSVKHSAKVQGLLGSIFMALVVEAERDIRRRLAERLAGAEWAPAALINVLALDDIEIARPIIASSPVLQDADLVRLLLEATLEHQVAVARRPQLGAPVIAAILAQEEPAVLTALAANTSVRLGAEALSQLVKTSRRMTALRSPLVRRPELTADLARELYVWVGQSLRQALASGFRLDMESLDAAIASSVQEAHGGAPLEAAPAPLAVADGEREEMERRLVGKLKAAGQLKPGYLMRALRDGKLSLFASALAVLGEFDPEQVRKALDSERAELLALACAAVGIDRSVFPTMLGIVRELNGERPGGGADGLRRAGGAFGPYAPEVAALAFRQAVAAG